MRWIPLVALASLASLAAAGCGGSDCIKSADIQVTVAPDSDVSVGDVVRLHVILSINDAMVGTNDIDLGPQLPLAQSGSTFLLHPDPAPAAMYDVALTVQAFGVDNTLVAIGSDSMQALSSGCNKMTVNLTALPQMSVGDMAVPPGSDLAGMVPGADMAGCVGGTPDEDSDTRADFCDLCPDDSDPTPVDTDEDGLPDACDPDPTMGTNHLVYFDPFNSDSGHWPGGNTVANSSMTLNSGTGQLATGNATDMLPANVRVQTHVFLNGIFNSSDADAGIVLSTTTNLTNSMNNGAWCLISTSDKQLELYPVKNGQPQQATLANIGMPNGLYRLRLTNSNGTWTCEMLAIGGTPVSVTTTQAVTGPLFVTLIVDGSKVNYNAVVAETKL